ncbi:uncharacterized protein LOC129362814 [Poeciliopsis prolifica]|uniref:uncharacterized protein LOC129362814 n=1 Tax=Poeciliopsis prolifica TaxID=188132 RepID=UPI002412EE18|nr:uncharacterized protein LOC129362814 [Poeciliopsis prolifica]
MFQTPGDIRLGCRQSVGWRLVDGEQEDVQRLHRHLEKTAEQELKDLEDHSSPKLYSELCEMLFVDNLQLTDSDAESEVDDEEEVDADHEVDEGNFTDLQTDSAGLLTRQPVEEPLGTSASFSQASLESTRRAKKHPWSPIEVAAVMRHFGEHIKTGQLATMIECQQCKKAEDPALARRSIQNIRDFVRNRGVTLKRKENPAWFMRRLCVHQ